MTFASSFTNSLNGTLSAIQRTNDMKRQDTLDARADKLFEQDQAELADRRKRRSMLEARTDADYEQAKINQGVDREYELQQRELIGEDQQFARERARTVAEQQDQLHPLQMQAQQATINGQMDRQRLDRINIRIAEQTERSQKAASIVSQAKVLAQNGDLAGAEKVYQQLTEHGYNVPALSAEGAIRARETLKGIISGDISMDSPQGVALAKEVLTPSLVASGRDPERYKIAGLRRTNRGTFTVAMRDEQTNNIVPATLGASADPEDSVVTEISPEQLISAAQNWVMLAESRAQTQIDATGARFGLAPPVRDAHTNAKTAKLQAETEQILAKIGQADGLVYSETQREAFTESYATDPDAKAMAGILSADPKFDPETAVPAIRGALALLTEDETLMPQEALTLYRDQEEIETGIASYTEQLQQQNPSLEPDKAAYLARRVQTGKMTIEQLKARLESLNTEKAEQEASAVRVEQLEERRSNLRQQEGEDPIPTGYREFR